MSVKADHPMPQMLWQPPCLAGASFLVIPSVLPHCAFRVCGACRLLWVGAKRRKERRKVVAYGRTSSATNVGADKDSEKRQRVAIEAFAKRAGLDIVDWFYEPGGEWCGPHWGER